jgi:hypothetical protein
MDMELNKAETIKDVAQPLPGWFTTVQLRDLYGIPMSLSQRWVTRLNLLGHAKKLAGGRGLWLVSEAAVGYLVSRKGKRGRPRAKLSEGGESVTTMDRA